MRSRLQHPTKRTTCARSSGSCALLCRRLRSLSFRPHAARRILNVMNLPLQTAVRADRFLRGREVLPGREVFRVVRAVLLLPVVRVAVRQAGVAMVVIVEDMVEVGKGAIRADSATAAHKCAAFLFHLISNKYELQ